MLLSGITEKVGVMVEIDKYKTKALLAERALVFCFWINYTSCEYYCEAVMNELPVTVEVLFDPSAEDIVK